MTRARTLAALSFVALAFSALPARAYRPFDSTDADTAEFHHVEIELGPIGYLATGKLQQLELPAVVLNYGFLPGWEAVAETIHVYDLNPVASSQSRDHLIDTFLTVKHVLKPGVLQEQSGVSVATEFGFLLPNYNASTGFGLWVAIICSWRWPQAAIHLNLAFESTGAIKPGTEDGVIIEGPDAWTVRPVVELLGEYISNGTYTATALGGAIWRINDSVSIDAALRGGTSDQGIVREVRAGVTWSFSVLPTSER